MKRQLDTIREDAMQARDVMTPDPAICETNSSVADAAKLMKDRGIGDVLVRDQDGSLCGIVTDRDIVVRAIATNEDPSSLQLGEICSHELHTVAPDTSVGEVIQMMEDHALRRVPVVEGSNAIGIISIGDLAIHRDPDSALGRISSAPPNT